MFSTEAARKPFQNFRQYGPDVEKGRSDLSILRLDAATNALATL